MNTRRKAVLDRIELVEEAIERAKEYLKAVSMHIGADFGPGLLAKRKMARNSRHTGTGLRTCFFRGRKKR